MTDRIPCINPRCRRTAPRDKHSEDDEIVCYKCWQTLPKRLKDRYRSLRKRERKLIRLYERQIAHAEIDPERLVRLQISLWHLRMRNWIDIRSHLLDPQSPQGIESFLKEIGMNDCD